MSDPVAQAGVLRCRLALLPPPKDDEDPALTAKRNAMLARIVGLEASIEPKAEVLPYSDR